MQRDNKGSIQYDLCGEVEKYYPRQHYKLSFVWKCNSVKIKSNLSDTDEKQIIVYKYLRGPHEILDDGKTYKADRIVDYPEDIQEGLQKLEFESNCFRYALLDNIFWVEPELDCFIYKILVIQNILDSDNYREIKFPEPNSIALFSKDGNYTHAFVTDDGDNWRSKNGVGKIASETLAENIKQFGSVKFYTRNI